MSRVTNVIISCSLEDEGASQKLNEKLQNHPTIDLGSPFKALDECAGTKNLEVVLLIGAMNHLIEKDLAEVLGGIQWNDPESVELFVLGQQDRHWRKLSVPVEHIP